MSGPGNETDNADIVFTIGTGNQSAICGGVVPMKIIDPEHNKRLDNPDCEVHGLPKENKLEIPN